MLFLYADHGPPLGDVELVDIPEAFLAVDLHAEMAEVTPEVWVVVVNRDVVRNGVFSHCSVP